MTPPPLWLAILQAARVDRRLRGEDLRVLLYAAEHLVDDAPRVFKSWHAAGDLKLQTANVARAVDRLVLAGYMVRHVPTGGFTVAVPASPALSRADAITGDSAASVAA
jgi:hypothetical protein